VIQRPENESVYVTQTKTTSGLGIAALVLGLVACLGCWIPFAGLLSIPFAAFGIFFGVLGIIISKITRRSYIGLPVAGTLVSITAAIVAVAITGPLAYIGCSAIRRSTFHSLSSFFRFVYAPFGQLPSGGYTGAFA